MQYRTLGRTGIDVSCIGLGAGPVPALMTGDNEDRQYEVLAKCLALGINWVDTAAGYGNGQSEESLGRAIRALKDSATPLHIATKVRLTPEDLANIETAVRRSLEGSLSRLGRDSVTLVQLHNGIASKRGDIAASLTSDDAVRIGEAMNRLREDGLFQWIGLTGTGDTGSLQEVITSGTYDTIQIPHHLLTPAEGTLLHHCEQQQMGVFAIRVFAAGALLGHEPSAHTHRTPYFPLALYEEDRRRARELQSYLGSEISLKELALRFALRGSVPQVALVGMATPEQVEEVVELAQSDPQDERWRTLLDRAMNRVRHPGSPFVPLH